MVYVEFTLRLTFCQNLSKFLLKVHVKILEYKAAAMLDVQIYLINQ